MALFHDRTEAGRQLAAFLMDYARNRDCVVLALPRGGVPVGLAIAKALHAPLDVYIVRKLGVPGHEELAMGAVASDGNYVVDESIVEAARVTRSEFEAVMTRELVEIKRREATYRAGRTRPELPGKSVIVVDDGLATGSTMAAALIALRRRDPAELAAAVPVAPADAVSMLERYADRVFCPYQPISFGAVGFYYTNFDQLEDDDVARLLNDAKREGALWNVA